MKKGSKYYILGLIFILFVSCRYNKVMSDLATEDPNVEFEIIELRVNSNTEDCVGEMQTECLLVQWGDAIGTENWKRFHDKNGIENFRYIPGYIYDLKIRRSPVANPPADASAFRYELITILSKEKQ